MNVSEQGRYAEAEVMKLFDKLRAERNDFTYWRCPDIRARAKIPTLCDFVVASAGLTYLVEVRDCPSPWKLLYKQMDIDRLNHIREFTQCGVRGVVWTWHYKPAKWRAMPIEHFYTRPDAASWDLEKFSFREELAEDMLWVLR